jgi:tetratricopeptide (TPR) repeat protein
MLGAVAGFSGDRNRGIKTLNLVAEKGRMNRFDADAILAVVYRREKRPAEAVPRLLNLIEHFPRAYLLRLELAEMYGDMQDRPHAMAAVDQVEELKRNGAPGYARLPEAQIHYARGSLLLVFNELDRALEEMSSATATAGDLDLVTAGHSWLRLGQVYDLKKQRSQAIAAYQRAISVSPDSDAAIEAKNYLVSRYKQ